MSTRIVVGPVVEVYGPPRPYVITLSPFWLDYFFVQLWHALLGVIVDGETVVFSPTVVPPESIVEGYLLQGGAVVTAAGSFPEMRMVYRLQEGRLVTVSLGRILDEPDCRWYPAMVSIRDLSKMSWRPSVMCAVGRP